MGGGKFFTNHLGRKRILKVRYGGDFLYVRFWPISAGQQYDLLGGFYVTGINSAFRFLKGNWRVQCAPFQQ